MEEAASGKTPQIIRCDEVIVQPVIIQLGDISVDISRVSAYNSIRTLELIQTVRNKTADPQEATSIILDIIREQGQDISQEELLRAGNQAQLNRFTSELVKYVLRTYAPLEAHGYPFAVPAQPERR